MDRLLLAYLCSFGSAVWSFEKLDPKYQIAYGNPESSIKIVEYFSLSCPKCFDFFLVDFPLIKRQYLDTDEISWIFHPDPADLLTLQAMVCLEHLPDGQKRCFLETVLKHLKEKNYKHGCLIMQAAMEVLGYPLQSLAEMGFLETTEAFKEAFAFLKQKDVITSIPMVEINGKLREEYPTKEFLEKEITSLRKRISMRSIFAYSVCLFCVSCGAYNTSFDCPAGKGVGCAPVNEVLDMIVEREHGEDLFITDLGEALILKQEEAKNVKVASNAKKKKPKLHLKKEHSGELVLSEEEG